MGSFTFACKSIRNKQPPTDRVNNCPSFIMVVDATNILFYGSNQPSSSNLGVTAHAHLCLNAVEKPGIVLCDWNPSSVCHNPL